MKAYEKLYLMILVGLGVVLGVMGVGGALSGSLLSTAFAAESPTTILILQHAGKIRF